MNAPSEKTTIGWREWLSLPDLNVPGIKAKVDTGARSSSLHTHDYQVIDRNGVDFVRFQLHPLTSTDVVLLTCEAPILEYREVKDSGGHAERRPFVRSRVRLGTIEWEIDLSLTNREGMKFRMLLGREALADRFVVDPGCNYLVGRSLASEYQLE